MGKYLRWKLKAPVKASEPEAGTWRSEKHFKYPVHSNVQVKVTQTTEAHKVPQIINTLQKGDYFGEKALIR